MNVEDLLRRYAGGKRDFSWADLSGADLTGADLAGVNLYGANLSQAVLVETNLHKANLLKANLTGANLTKANLTIANLRKANLTGAKLEEANLEEANLSGAIAPDGQPFLVATSSLEEPDEKSGEESDEKPRQTQSEPVEPKAIPGQSIVPPPTKRPSTWVEFRDHLPWSTLICSAVGFSLFGGLLLLHQATIVSWWIVWAISLVGTVSEANTWFVPLLPALVVVLAAKAVALQSVSVAGYTTLWQFSMVGIAMVALFCCLKFLLGYTWQRSFQDVLAIGSVGFSFTQLFVWVMSGSWLLALLLVLAIGFTGLGAITWMQMQDTGFSRLQIRWTVAIVSAIGLVSIRLLGAATLR